MSKVSVELDQELYNFLRSQIVNFNESPNDVIKRLLFENQKNKKFIIPIHVPRTLQQILEVIYKVKSKGISRIQATKEVAYKWEVSYSTIMDKYSRQAKINGEDLGAARFDRLLEAKRKNELKDILIQNFPKHTQEINRFFSNI